MSPYRDSNDDYQFSMWTEEELWQKVCIICKGHPKVHEMPEEIETIVRSKVIDKCDLNEKPFYDETE